MICIYIYTYTHTCLEQIGCETSLFDDLAISYHSLLRNGLVSVSGASHDVGGLRPGTAAGRSDGSVPGEHPH